MSGSGTEKDLVTGAFSYSGSRIAELLMDSERAAQRAILENVDLASPAGERHLARVAAAKTPE
jgi:hypothetical protein